METIDHKSAHLNRQVWFQNRRSKERRMKNSNGSVRRNFFRTSSRRTRIGVTGGVGAGATQSAGVASGQQQQSLIANRNATHGNKRDQQQQLSPMEPADQLLGVGNQQQQQQHGARQHNSPSEFGGSSSGGFTYFSGKQRCYYILIYEN